MSSAANSGSTSGSSGFGSWRARYCRVGWPLGAHGITVGQFAITHRDERTATVSMLVQDMVTEGVGDIGLNQVSDPVMVIDAGSLGNLLFLHSVYVRMPFALTSSFLCSFSFPCFLSYFCLLPNSCSLREQQRTRSEGPCWDFRKQNQQRDAKEREEKDSWSFMVALVSVCSLLFPIPIFDFFIIFL